MCKAREITLHFFSFINSRLQESLRIEQYLRKFVYENEYDTTYTFYNIIYGRNFFLDRDFNQYRVYIYTVNIKNKKR